MKLKIVLGMLLILCASASNCLAGFGNNQGGSLASLMLIYSLGVFIVFLILREFLCWYWKINRTLSTLEEVSSTNNKMLEQLQQLVKYAANTPEEQKIIAESKILEAQGEESSQAARKMRLATLNNRNVCPTCYKDYSKYVTSCETCDSKLEPCEVVVQTAF